MMDIKEAIWERKSIRTYKKKNIDNNTLNKIVEAGTMAPSACNQQRYSLIVIDDNNIKNRLINEADAWQIGRGPVAIYVVCDKTYNNRRLANVVGTAMSVQNMMLYAYSIGIGSIVMAGYGIEPEVRKILQIPKNQHIICALSFGYSNEKPIRPLKRNVDRIIYNNALSQNYNPKDPSNWDWIDILEFWDTTISAKSPDIGYYSFFKEEFESTIKLLSNKISNKNLVLFDDFALYSIELARKNPEADFDCLVSSKILRNWCRERAKYLGLENIKFFDKKNSIGKYKIILLLDTLNRIPTNKLDEIFNIARNTLHQNGNFIISFINYYSIYGFYIRKGIGRRFGPEISIKRSIIKKYFKKHNFVFSDSYGINLIPSLGSLLHLGLPKKLEFLMPIIRFWLKINIFEKLISKYVFKSFCHKYIYITKKNIN